ncbi:MAG: MFS transporter [Clostridiales bacterium]|jgi:MFS family permease|nr:MFS transporter [Clostridiales bacterium]
MKEKEPILTKIFIYIFMAQFFCALVMYILITTIGEYVTAFGASATIAGIVSGIYLFGGLVSRLYSGSLLNRFGWKRIAMVSLIIHFVASCCYFLAENVVFLIIIRFIHGLGFGAATNAIMVIAMASLPKSRYGEATGYFMLSTSLAIAIGPFAGGLIYDLFGGKGSFLTCCIFSFLSVIFMGLANVKEIEQEYATELLLQKEIQAKGISSFIEPKAVPISLSIMFMSLGYAAMISFYRLYAVSVNMTKEFSIFFLVYAAVLIVSRPIAGKIQDRFGDDVVCYPSFIIQPIGLALLAYKPSILTIVICASAGALGYGTMNSCLNAILNRNISNERRPYATTTYWSCCDLGVGVGPMFLGAIVAAFGYHTMYFAVAALSLVAMPLYYYAKRKLV